jgi:hypothetical protein
MKPGALHGTQIPSRQHYVGPEFGLGEFLDLQSAEEDVTKCDKGALKVGATNGSGHEMSGDWVTEESLDASRTRM